MRRCPLGMKLVFLITLMRRSDVRRSSKASKISQLSVCVTSALSFTRMAKYLAYMEVMARMSWSVRMHAKYSSTHVTYASSSVCSARLSNTASSSSRSFSSPAFARLQQQQGSPPPSPPWWRCCCSLFSLSATCFARRVVS
jgi:hypothetical protein